MDVQVDGGDEITGGIYVDGHQVVIPQFEVLGMLGKGANGVVHRARDLSLQRDVAIKVWNSRGRDRAQFEAIKIAGLSHPLIVVTHQFGEIDGFPYVVMELVAGQCGKAWLKTQPSVSDRFRVWRQYSQALRHIYAQGMRHGDPHLGNVLVYEEQYPDVARGSSVSMKLADTGTSEMWSDEAAFASREANIVTETFHRVFQSENAERLAPYLCSPDAETALARCDEAARCLTLLWDTLHVWEARSQFAEAIVSIVMETPIFDLDELERQLRKSEITPVSRVATRLNARLQRIQNFLEADDEITDDTRQLYSLTSQTWRDAN